MARSKSKILWPAFDTSAGGHGGRAEIKTEEAQKRGLNVVPDSPATPRSDLTCDLGPSRLPNLAKSLGESARAFKKGLKGEGDIDVTDSVKRLDEKD